jgi:serine/threonine protein kinase
MLDRGTIIDSKYSIVDAMGGGSFGAVYSAVQQQLDRRVAVKLLNSAVLQQSDGAARFEREAKVINSVKHRNIVGLYGYGAWQGAPYMVMELIDGKSLTDLLAKEKTLEPNRALGVIRQILDALDCAHSGGVVHRDLKPSNIMLSGNDEVKVIDFGLAKMMPGYNVTGQRLTETGCAVGTCFYMAPEQALGVDVDHRVDIYAAGCMLYLMVTGHVPFDGDDGIAVMYQHINEYPKPVAELIPASPAVQAIAKVIENCMAKEPDKRYQTCREVIRDVDAILAGKGASVSLKQRRPKPKKTVSAKPSRTLLLKISVASVVVLACGWTGYHKIDNDRRAVEVRQSRQRFADAAVLQQLLRTTGEQSLSELEQIKVRDDADHYLQPSERFILSAKLSEYYRISPDLRAGNRLMHQKLSMRCAEDALNVAFANPNDQQIWDKLFVIQQILRSYDSVPEANALAVRMIASKFPDAQQRGYEAMMIYYIDEKDWAKALQMGESGLAVPLPFNGLKHDMLSWMGHIRTILDEPDKARALFLKSSSDGNPDAYAGLARLSLLNGKYDQALEFAQMSETQWERDEHAVGTRYWPAVQMWIAATAAKGNIEKAKQLTDRFRRGATPITRKAAVFDLLDEKMVEDAMAGAKPTLRGFDAGIARR